MRIDTEFPKKFSLPLPIIKMFPSVPNGDSSVNTDTSSVSTPSPRRIDCHSSLFDAVVSKCVSDVIFPKKQFVVLEKELDSSGKLAGKVLKTLEMEQKD